MKGSGNSACRQLEEHDGISADIRRQLVALIRKGRYDASFSRTRPTVWEPTRVRNPDGSVDGFFTDQTAWTFVADRLEQGVAVQVKDNMRKPPGSKGYVMKVEIGSDVPMLYIKLQLGPGKVWGRSFHYTRCV